jgi:2',3'-cyclic-nucleotide 2'-phosphodiesterase (5'-nucleotidase family)
MVVKIPNGEFLSPPSAYSSSPQEQQVSSSPSSSLRPSPVILASDDPWNAVDDESGSDSSGSHAPPLLPLLSDNDSSGERSEHDVTRGISVGRRGRRDSNHSNSESEDEGDHAWEDEAHDSLLEPYANLPESPGNISIPTISDDGDEESDEQSDDEERESEQESGDGISLPSRPLFVEDDDPDYYPNENKIVNQYSSSEGEEFGVEDGYYSGSDDPDYHPNERKIPSYHDTTGSSSDAEEFYDDEYYPGSEGEEESSAEESSIAEDDHFFQPQLKSIPEALNESATTFPATKTGRTRPSLLPPPPRTYSDGDQSLSLSDLKANDPLAKSKNKKEQLKRERGNNTDPSPGDGGKDEPKDKDGIPSVRNKCMRWALLLLLAFLLFDTALLVAFLVKRGKADSPAAVTVAVVATAAPLDPEKRLANVYVTLCLEWVPGQGKSGLCLPEATPLGGQVGNLVATAIRQQTGADIALISAGTTQDDIPAGIFTVGDVKKVLGRDVIHPLVQLQVSGEQIEIVLEQAMVSSLDDFRPNHYPYAAGMRFDVNGGGSLNDRFLAGSSMVSNVEVNIQDEWVPLDTGQMYTLTTTNFMANGGEGYLEFANVEGSLRQALVLDVGTALMDYADFVEDLEEPESSTKSFVNQLVNRRLATVPKNICLEWVPGQGKSEICSGEEYVEQAGGACNLVSWAMVVQAGSEVAILNAGECRSDIWQGGFWVEDAQTLLRTNLQLVILNITGSEMVRALEGAVDNALGGSNDNSQEGSYPYAGGLRYTVDASAGMGSRLSNVEWFAEGKTWSELSPQRYYQLVTTLYLALGNDGYDEFENVPRKDTNMKLQSVFIEYAESWELMSDPPRDKYSTQQFIAT